MITGYYVRGNAHGAWALVEQDERYRETVVADGLSNEEAVALYWRKMAELVAAPKAAAIAKPEPIERPAPQLSLDL